MSIYHAKLVAYIVKLCAKTSIMRHLENNDTIQGKKYSSEMQQSYIHRQIYSGK